MELNISQLPSTLELYWRIFQKSENPEKPWPALDLELNPFQLDSGQLNKYLRIFNFSSPEQKVPLPFIYVLLQRAQLFMMSDSQMPFKLMGLLHIGQRFEQSAPINPSLPLAVSMRLGPLQPQDNGEKFSTFADIIQNDTTIASSESFFLKRRPKRNKKIDRDIRLPNEAGITGSWHAERSVVKQYAALTGDRNPIHMFDWSAKLFGYPKAIAHGMCQVSHFWARELPKVQRRSDVVTADFSFKKPVFIGTELRLELLHAQQSPTLELAVWSGNTDLHLTGQLEFH